MMANKQFEGTTMLSGDRVRAHTAPEVNARIDQVTREHLFSYAEQPEAAIASRIEALEREWDIERTLEINAATIGLIGLMLGVTVSRRWLFLPGVVFAFLAQHALQGWCPPMAVFRRLGIRTRREIDIERFVLKAVRGDFDAVGAASNTTERVNVALQSVLR
jgi:hypothetical protein